MFDSTFFSPQVKRSVLVGNKHGIYELPHELPNDLRVAAGRAFIPTQEEKTYIKKISKLYRMIA